MLHTILKNDLTDIVISKISPIREEMNKLMNDKSFLQEILKSGSLEAKKIASKSLITTTAIKESVNRSFETSLADGLLFERRTFHALFSTEDQSEGMTAFIEKRSPKFKDR